MRGGGRRADGRRSHSTRTNGKQPLGARLSLGQHQSRVRPVPYINHMSQSVRLSAGRLWLWLWLWLWPRAGALTSVPRRASTDGGGSGGQRAAAGDLSQSRSHTQVTHTSQTHRASPPQKGYLASPTVSFCDWSSSDSNRFHSSSRSFSLFFSLWDRRGTE